jgi:hypothetical protein
MRVRREGVEAAVDPVVEWQQTLHLGQFAQVGQGSPLAWWVRIDTLGTLWRLRPHASACACTTRLQTPQFYGCSKHADPV